MQYKGEHQIRTWSQFDEELIWQKPYKSMNSFMPLWSLNYCFGWRMFWIIVPGWQDIRIKTLSTIPTKNIHIQPWFSTKKTVDHLTQTPTWSKLTLAQDINTLRQSNASHSSISEWLPIFLYQCKPYKSTGWICEQCCQLISYQIQMLNKPSLFLGPQYQIQ